MLTISSIGVAPRPQLAPTVQAQPVSTAKRSNAVPNNDSGTAVGVVPSGEGNQVQAVSLPNALPPVDPTREAVSAEVPTNAAAPERPVAAEARAVQVEQSKKRIAEEPSELQKRVAEELATLVHTVVPRAWEASRVTVDALIGEDVMAAAARAAEMAGASVKGQQQASAEAAQNYAEQSGQAPEKSKPGSVVNTKV